MASLKLVALFPEYLYADGDRGNRRCLAQRLAWRGIECVEERVTLGETHSLADADLVLLGGGEEHDVHELMQILGRGMADNIRSAIASGVPFLCTGGSVPILGTTLEAEDGRTIEGLGLVAMQTRRAGEKILGNYAFRLREELGGDAIVGFENHQGKSYLDSGVKPLGKIEKGKGNNGEDGTEGVTFQNVFGTYCQGPLLPKHPAFCDRLLQIALDRRYGSYTLEPLDDSIEHEAHDTMWERVLSGTAEKDQ